MKNLVILVTLLGVVALVMFDVHQALKPEPVAPSYMCGPVAQNVLRCEPAK